MARNVTVVTPENVRIEYELAGLASRGGAALLDLLAQGGILLVIFGIRLILDSYDKWPGTTWANAILGVAMFLAWYGYFLVFETIWNGQTPGKRHARLRAVREGGLPMDFTSAAVRNLVRTVDFLPALYVFGAISMLFHGRNKRLGDIAGGTIVVKERAEWMPQQSFANSAPAFRHTQTHIRNIELIDKEEFEAVKRFVERMPELDDAVRRELASRIAAPIMLKLGVANDAHTDHTAWLKDIFAACTDIRGMR